MDYRPFPKVPRINARVVVTEKIDGTNAQVQIVPCDHPDYSWLPEDKVIARDGNNTAILAGSRKRWITPDDDNYGFARWVQNHAYELIDGLGEGHHYGEWWGQGIQRGYGLEHKRFSLFNSVRWYKLGTKGFAFTADWAGVQHACPECCYVVPVLHVGAPNGGKAIERAMLSLSDKGSVAAPGFMNPEGVIIYYPQANLTLKRTYRDDRFEDTMLKEVVL